MVETRIQANARLTGIFGLDIDPIYHREKKYLNAKKKKKDEKEDFHHRGTESTFLCKARHCCIIH